MLASFAVQLLNGLAGASALFLVAVGLSLICGVPRTVDFGCPPEERSDEGSQALRTFEIAALRLRCGLE